MSSSRSVAAAQRRRAGPTNEAPATRGPSTSINSSQVFNQPQGMRPGTTGRLAGQHAAVSQQQHLQGTQIQPSAEPGLTPLKMSIPQAITLVSLRLGKLENQIQNLEGLSLGESSTTQYDADVINVILQRLDNLENKTNEISALKQQLDLLKPAVVSVKNISSGAVKDISVLKMSIEQIKTELTATKITVDDLQLYLSNDTVEQVQEYVNEPESLQLEVSQEIETVAISNNVANLKDLVEQELNA